MHRPAIVPGFLTFMLCANVAGCRSASAARATTREPMPVSRFRRDGGSFTAYSGIRDSVRTVIRDSARWRDYWTAINRPFIPPPSLPPINFAREMVVLAALGLRPSAGFDLLIESAVRDSSGIEIVVRRTSPAEGCPVGAVVTQPVDLVRIPSSELPVRFSERSTVVPCGTP